MSVIVTPPLFPIFILSPLLVPIGGNPSLPKLVVKMVMELKTDAPNALGPMLVTLDGMLID